MSKTISASSVSLWIFFGLACLFLWPFDEKVECETRQGHRAIQFMSYIKLEVWLPLPGIGGPRWSSKHYGVRFVDAWHSKWLMARVDEPWAVRHAACTLAVVNTQGFMLYPVKSAWRTELTFSGGAFGVESTVPKKIGAHWREGLVSGGFPFYFFSAIQPFSRDMRLVLSEASIKGAPEPWLEWITTGFEGVGSKQLLATQFGRLHSDAGRHIFPALAYEMGGHPKDEQAFKYSLEHVRQVPNAQVSLKRRLRSVDGGRTWELHEWEVLRPDLLPPASKILPACPC